MAKKRSQTRKSKKAQKARRQLFSIVWFAVGLLLTALAFVSGQNVWLMGHDFLRGVFSLFSYAVGPIVIYSAVLLAMGKDNGTIASKCIQCFLCVLLLCALLHLFTIPEESLSDMQVAYTHGVAAHGGGVFALLLCAPLYLWFGKTAAVIMVCVLLFVFIMVVARLTLMQFLHAAKKPVDVIEKAYEKTVEDYHEKKERKVKFNIDVPLGPAPGSHREEVVPVRENTPFTDTVSTEDVSFISEQDHKEKEASSEILPWTEEEIIPIDEENDEPEKTMTDEMDTTADAAVEAEMPKYEFPPLRLLDRDLSAKNVDVSAEQQMYANRLVEALKSFGVNVTVTNVSRGPSVTRFELQPSVGVRINKITSLSDDIALALAAESVRIEAPIPGKSAVGIEIPNKTKNIVKLYDVIASQEFSSASGSLSYALGKDLTGSIMVGNIAKMPHMLIAGATGSGKSVCVNSLLISLLYKSSPDDVKMILIDPKVVELSVYNGIPHLLLPVVNDPKKAAGALCKAVEEMMNRYKIFADNDVKDISGYNELANIDDSLPKMPHIVIVIDELADLMMASPKDVEDYICRLAQMARAAGMHLVIATQRPSVDVITGLIKTNIPSRIAFAVSSQIDSRVILDTSGAEKLLGKGDMLYSPIGCNKPMRIQGCFVSEKEIKRVTDFVKKNGENNYDLELIKSIDSYADKNTAKGVSDAEAGSDGDEIFDQAVECVLDAGQASVSLLQRRLRVGYARAGRLVDEMEQKGIIGPSEGSKPRQVLISKQEWAERKMIQAE